jgi:hypothetical protein
MESNRPGRYKFRNKKKEKKERKEEKTKGRLTMKSSTKREERKA